MGVWVESSAGAGATRAPAEPGTSALRLRELEPAARRPAARGRPHPAAGPCAAAGRWRWARWRRGRAAAIWPYGPGWRKAAREGVIFRRRRAANPPAKRCDRLLRL